MSDLFKPGFGFYPGPTLKTTDPTLKTTDMTSEKKPDPDAGLN